MDMFPTGLAGLVNVTDANEDGETIKKDPRVIHTITGIEILVFIMALCGNLFLVVLMRAPTMKRFSFSVYFTFAAVFDTVTIFWNCLEDGYELKHDSLLEEDASRSYTLGCGVLEIMDSWFPTTSVWLVVAVCVDRYISICHVALAQSFCRRKIALLVCLVVITCTFIFELPWPLIVPDRLSNNSSETSIRCGLEPGDNTIGVVFAEDYVQVLIPLIVVSILNARILVVLKRKKAFRSETCLTEHGRRQNQDNNFNISIFYLLVITILAWIPWMIVNMIITINFDYLGYDDNTVFRVHLSYAWHATLVIWLFTFAQNFYVLMFMSPVYRKELRQQCACLPWFRAIKHERLDEAEDASRNEEETCAVKTFKVIDSI